MSYRDETVRNVLVKNVPCGFKGCATGKDAVHVLLVTLPVAPAETPLCAYHSPFDVEEKKITEIYPVGEPVRVTYEHEGEFYFFDGEVTEISPRSTRAIGTVREYENEILHQVYRTDKVESLESLYTPKES